MLLAKDLIHEIEQTEAVHFSVISSPHSPGVGADFFAKLGRFNTHNTLNIQLYAVFPQENWFKLEVSGSGADVPLTRDGIKELLAFFNVYYLNSWSRAHLKDFLVEEGKWPEK